MSKMSKENEAYWRGYNDGYACAKEDNAKLCLVRCKDCKHRIPNPHGYTCKKIFKEVSLDDYCAWGERREDGSEAHEG